MIKRLALPLLISALFLFLFLYLIPFKEITTLISSIEGKELLGAFLLYTLSQITRSLRWKILLRELSLVEAYLINSANIFLNNLLPARTGELSWFYYAKRLGVELKSSLWSFFLGRLYDLLGLLLLFILSYAFNKSPVLIILSLLGLLGFSLLLPMVCVVIPSVGKLIEFKSFLKRELTPSLSLKLSLLSTLSFFLKALSLFILMSGYLSLDFFKFSFAFAGGELTTILPVHGFMGFGTYEAGFLLPLKVMGEEFKEGLKVGFAVHTFLLLASAFWGLISILLLHTLSRKYP
ncbi:hypothetical protein BCF55_1781 [Hydrogenivirga caldilitoris]|uniref:Lysylphosphatidylglycerol synthase-like protein n=1 Tax=Hydrogenivirga caldilitoris TaxID=246264 RepID=A0A497XTR4_9AQUI|nr:lysylphosphatidylglycerol synthase domain-containing protein [Hydrogenivirga caldilitoris]RLJ71479.1 hypothetical protein BCF55_1781 [Hydrogenivirga caldilitoris]